MKYLILALCIIVVGCMDVSGSYDNDNINSGGSDQNNGTTNITINQPENVYIGNDASNVTIYKEEISSVTNGNTITFDGKFYASDASKIIVLKFYIEDNILFVENLSEKSFTGYMSFEAYTCENEHINNDKYSFDVSGYGKNSLVRNHASVTIRNIQNNARVLWHGLLSITNNCEINTYPKNLDLKLDSLSLSISVDKLCHVFVTNTGSTSFKGSYCLNIDCYERTHAVKDVCFSGIAPYSIQQFYTFVGGHDTKIMTINSLRKEYGDKKVVWFGPSTISIQ